mmetsp:Transcript_3923/g.3808  ORF Transcript_3923/g.3808 Transcript_3923/m.3808 type:complete len:208 (-) Transcript_3923:956-1579(-)
MPHLIQQMLHRLQFQRLLHWKEQIQSQQCLHHAQTKILRNLLMSHLHIHLRERPHLQFQLDHHLEDQKHLLYVRLPGKDLLLHQYLHHLKDRHHRQFPHHPKEHHHRQFHLPEASHYQQVKIYHPGDTQYLKMMKASKLHQRTSSLMLMTITTMMMKMSFPLTRKILLDHLRCQIFLLLSQMLILDSTHHQYHQLIPRVLSIAQVRI